MQRLFLTWAHFLGKKLFITCMHAVHWIQDRLGCKRSLMELPAPFFLHWEVGALLAVLQGIAGKHRRCEITCLMPTCMIAAVVGEEAGALMHIIILALGAHLPFHPCSCSEPLLWLSCSSLFFCSLQPHCEHTGSCTLLGGPLLKSRHYLSLRQFTFLSSRFSTWGNFLNMETPFLAALSLLLALTSFAIISGQMLLAQQGHRSLWTAVLIIGFGRQYLALRPFSSFWFHYYKAHAQGFQLWR